MEEIHLTRYFLTSYATFGYVKLPQTGELIFTLELPWKNNEKGVSCIPKGRYRITPYISSKHGNCFRIYTVPGREAIRIHPFNSVRDNYKDPFTDKIWKCESEGCIAPGLYSRTDGIIFESKKAMAKLRKVINKEMVFVIN